MGELPKWPIWGLHQLAVPAFVKILKHETYLFHRHVWTFLQTHRMIHNF